MNITLSADKTLIEKSRAYARKHNTSLNQLVRDYLMKLVGQENTEMLAAEFEALSLEYPGKSDQGYRFDRDEIYSDRVG